MNLTHIGHFIPKHSTIKQTIDNIIFELLPTISSTPNMITFENGFKWYFHKSVLTNFGEGWTLDLNATKREYSTNQKFSSTPTDSKPALAVFIT